MVHTENHPFSALSRQIEQLLWASIIFGSFITLLSSVNTFRLSLLAAPCMFLITLIQNITLLALIARDRKKTTEQLADTLAPTAKRAAIISFWILAALWVLVAGVIMAMAVLILTMDGRVQGWEKLAGYVELPLVGAEICMLGFLAVKCAKQRRNTIVKPAHVDWQHFGPPASIRG